MSTAQGGKHLLVLLSLSLLTGCHSVNSSERAVPEALPQGIETKQVVRDVSLEKKASVVEIRESRTASGLLRIQAQIVNRTSRRQDISYCFEWFDKDGMAVKTPLSVWRTVSLAPKEQIAVGGTSPTEAVVDFRLKLKE
jgi:uncharacterized protein YcfL